ncbi:hypothetical protein [Streptomyces sp. NPDC006739]|uniref:hypothetical protein n=1 Tax=Streptomyces sp. NPDC006739 TaxID=3364763 RepID=UPI0036CA81D1
MQADAPAQALLPAAHTTPDQQHAAALFVASQAHDADDCRALLAMLGLTPTPKRKRGRPRGNHGHGHPARYAQGCRCPECRAANADRCRGLQERRVADPEAADRAGHGNASTYQNYGCRCRPCTEANSAKSLAYKQAQRAKRASVPATTTVDCPINTVRGAAS